MTLHHTESRTFPSMPYTFYTTSHFFRCNSVSLSVTWDTFLARVRSMVVVLSRVEKEGLYPLRLMD